MTQAETIAELRARLERVERTLGVGAVRRSAAQRQGTARALRAARQAAGLSLRDLAVDLGVSGAAVGQWETAGVPLDRLALVAEAFTRRGLTAPVWPE